MNQAPCKFCGKPATECHLGAPCYECVPKAESSVAALCDLAEQMEHEGWHPGARLVWQAIAALSSTDDHIADVGKMISSTDADQRRIVEALDGCEAIASGPNGSGGMKVTVHFAKPGQELPLFALLNATLTKDQPA